jgi:hypothetical protein
MAGGFSAYQQAQVLNWMFSGAAPTANTTWGVGLSQGIPTSVSASEATITGYTRQTASWAAAGTPSGSGTVVNKSAVLFTPKAACTFIGIQLWNSTAGGSMIAWGTLSASSVMASGDIASFAASSIVVTLT